MKLIIHFQLHPKVRKLELSVHFPIRLHGVHFNFPVITVPENIGFWYFVRRVRNIAKSDY